MRTLLFFILVLTTSSVGFCADGNIHGVTSYDEGIVKLLTLEGLRVQRTKIVQRTFWFTGVECPGEYVVEVIASGFRETKPITVGCHEPAEIQF